MKINLHNKCVKKYHQYGGQCPECGVLYRYFDHHPWIAAHILKRRYDGEGGLIVWEGAAYIIVNDNESFEAGDY